MESITVSLGRGETVTAQGTTQYQGTTTGGSGSRNVERYLVTILGYTVPGTWDGDARHNTEVATRDVAPELRAALMPLYRAQKAARERRELAAHEAAELKFYGRKARR